MIYGRDVAVEYPIMDLYDTGMMNAYLTAVKNEYERGIKEQEEFVSKYGDFISPFRKDVETWDRLTMDPIVQAYDQMQAAGIDPLRSQEGRALLASIRRRIPRDTLSQLRQSAAAGQEYLKNRGELQSKGLYDPEFENFLLNGTSFNDYDTTQSGMWSRTSPTEFKGLRTITDPWFKNRQAKYKYTKNGYDYYGYDENDMRTAVNDQIQAFLGNDYGRYYYNRALQRAQATAAPGESLESINKRAYDMLVNDIVDVNHDYLLNDRKANPYAMADYEFRNQLRLAATKRQWAKEDAEEERRNLYPASWTDALRDSINKNRGEKDYNRLRNVLVENQRRNQSVANNTKLSKSQRNRAQKMANWYSEAIKNYDDGTAWRTKDDAGHIIPTEAGYKILNAYDAKFRKNKYGPAYDSIENAYMNNNVTPIIDGVSRDKSYDFVAGRNTKALPGMTNSGEKYRYITFGGANNLRRARVAKVSGAGLTKYSISKQFNDFLRRNKVTGYVIDNQIGAGITPRRSGQGANIDFYYDVYIPETYVEDFAESVDLSADEVRSRMGLVHQKIGVQKVNGIEKDVYMDRIPTATTSTESSLRSWEDAQMDKTYFGTSNAYNLAPNRQGAALDYSNQ